MEEPRIYSCSVCGQMVELVHTGGGTLVCCGTRMQKSGERREKEPVPSNAPYWSCSNCHYVLQAMAPPDVCPSCGQSCQFVDVSCYIPECGLTGVDSRLIK